MVIGICRCKDEADIIASTVNHMLTQVDRVIVQDNNSTDGTFEILGTLDCEVWRDTNVGYYQSEAMSELARYAADQYKAQIVVPFDADEIWYSPQGRIADVFGEHYAAIYPARLYDHVATGLDKFDPDPVTRIGWRRRQPMGLPKVAVRPRPPVTIHQGNHGADFGPTIPGLLIVRHFPLRSVEQMIRKARNGGAAYAATNLPEHVGQHWRDWNRLTDEQIADAFRTHYWTAAPQLDPSLIYDPATACPSPP